MDIVWNGKYAVKDKDGTFVNVNEFEVWSNVSISGSRTSVRHNGMLVAHINHNGRKFIDIPTSLYNISN